MALKYDYILFDLDGTLSASADGIRICIEKTLEKLNKPIPDLSDYAEYIGPPLNRTFRLVCGLSDEETAEALPVYRSYYDIYGTKANRLYDGVREVLETIRKAGIQTAVCSSKNERLARDVTRYLGIEGLLTAVCGSKDDGSRKEKEDLIPYAMEALGCTDLRRALMVGDTLFDAKGAEAVGVDFLGALYGYGDNDALKAYPAVGFAATAGEILKYIG